MRDRAALGTLRSPALAGRVACTGTMDSKTVLWTLALSFGSSILFGFVRLEALWHTAEVSSPTG